MSEVGLNCWGSDGQYKNNAGGPIIHVAPHKSLSAFFDVISVVMLTCQRLLHTLHCTAQLAQYSWYNTEAGDRNNNNTGNLGNEVNN